MASLLTAAHVILALLLLSGFISAAPVQNMLQSQSEPIRFSLTSTTGDNATARAVRNACNLPDNVADLRDASPNYLSPLFAYSELLEQKYPPICSGSRKKRSDNDGECGTIERDVLSQVVPDNSSVLCPYTYKCDYDPSKYPRYIITAECSTKYPTNDTQDESAAHVHRCELFGEITLGVLQHNGDSWNTENLTNRTIHHGCQLQDVRRQS